jgi:hypothetical protein
LNLNKGYWAPTQYQDYTHDCCRPERNPLSAVGCALAAERKASGSLYDPNGLCLAAEWAATDDDTVPDGNPADAEAKAHRHDL